jgi:hypothetical protein
VTWTAPRTWVASETVTASICNTHIRDNLLSISSEWFPAPMLFTPGSNTDTAAGTNTWLTLGSITVPTWASSCNVAYCLNGIYDTGTTGNVTAVIKVGSTAGGVTKRLLGPGVANQRFHHPIYDRLSGISTGSQSVTIQTVQTTGTYRADGTSFVTAQFTFQP